MSGRLRRLLLASCRHRVRAAVAASLLLLSLLSCGLIVAGEATPEEAAR